MVLVPFKKTLTPYFATNDNTISYVCGKAACASLRELFTNF